MIHLLDVNVLIYSYREELSHHAACRDWISDGLSRDTFIGSPDAALSGFLRIITNPKVFTVPTPFEDAIDYLERLQSYRHWVVARPSSRQWNSFLTLCRGIAAAGNLVADAYLASHALAMDAQWVSTDRDFHRFPCLRVINPLVPPTPVKNAE